MTHHEIALWIENYFVTVFDIAAQEVDHAASFGDFGLSSAELLGLCSDLGRWLRVEIDESALYQHSSIAQLSDHLIALLDPNAAPSESQRRAWEPPGGST